MYQEAQKAFKQHKSFITWIKIFMSFDHGLKQLFSRSHRKLMKESHTYSCIYSCMKARVCDSFMCLFHMHNINKAWTIHFWNRREQFTFEIGSVCQTGWREHSVECGCDTVFLSLASYMWILLFGLLVKMWMLLFNSCAYCCH